MPASLKAIREAMTVAPTAKNKGLKLTITVTAYDNGVVEVNGVPMLGTPGSPDQAGGWLAAVSWVASTVTEFHRMVAKRQASPNA